MALSMSLGITCSVYCPLDRGQSNADPLDLPFRLLGDWSRSGFHHGSEAVMVPSHAFQR